jgi:hypothetical protein
MIMIVGLSAYELLLFAIRFFKSGLNGTLAAWPLYLGVLAGSRFVLLDGWARYFVEEMWLIGDIRRIVEIKKAVKQATVKLKTLGLPQKLLTRNVLFMPMWLILAIFAFTSITGWFGKGLILGIGWQWFEWKLKNRPWNKPKELIVLGYAVVFCLASFLI